MTSLGRFDFMFAYAGAKMAGKITPKDCVDEAHRILGVTSTVEGDLLLRAKELGALVEQYRAAGRNGKLKLKLKRDMKALIPILYHDICPEHQKRIHRAVRYATDTGRRSSDYGMDCFYEAVQKDLEKTGCFDCPLQKRFLHD